MFMVECVVGSCCTYDWLMRRICLKRSSIHISGFLEGAKPSKNPEMWSDDLFKQMRRISQSYVQHEPATVSTFTSAGLVRRGLRGAGFDVQKQQGFGRKREMLAGQFTRLMGPEQPPYFHNKP